MDGFDRRLSELPWRKPSPVLKERIFGASASEPRPERFWQKSIGLGWATALCLLVGFMGFVAGSMLPDKAASPAPLYHDASVALVSAETDLRVIETFSPRNSFDLSLEAAALLPGDLTAYVDDAEEVEQ